MGKNVLVVSASLRPTSNSHALALAFAEGAREAGHDVETVSLRGKRIEFCRGCLACQAGAACPLKDDAAAIVERIVAADARSPRDGRFIEMVGHYDSTTEPAVVKIDEVKAIAWLQKGAQPTDTVKSLFSKAGILKKWDELKRQ